MTRECSYPACDAPLTVCNLGKRELEACEYWQHVVEKEAGSSGSTDSAGAMRTDDARVSDDGARHALPDGSPEPVVSWVGGSLGYLDLELVATRSLPRLIGIVGPHNAGKTTLLTVLYLLLWRGRQLRGRSFAGSYTLGGWEDLAYSLRWQPGQPPQFPPHTSRTTARVPGLLHLAFRRDDGFLEDTLFTDAPGEWFEAWAANRSSPLAAGARWTVQNAAALALVVDSAALAGPERGRARAEMIALVRRLSDESDGRRRIAVVWSKSDEDVRKPVRDTLRQAFKDHLPGHREFNVSVYPTEDRREPDLDAFVRLFDWLLEEQGATMPEPIPAPVDPTNLFLAFRGDHG